MDIKISIPTSLNDITIEQYFAINSISEQDLTDYEKENQLIKLFTKIEQVEAILKKDRDKLVAAIIEAVQKEGTFKNRFTLGNIEFGMIPNFDKITASEYTDLIKYSEKEQDLHRLMAVAFRPIKLKDKFKNYQIVNYNGTHELCELMKQTPMSIVKGFNAFFLNLSNDLEAYTRRSMEEAQAKATAL